MIELIKLSTFKDERGSFTPISAYVGEEVIHDVDWEQFNVVTNPKEGTFRGMHFQTDPVQRKLIKVIKGEIIDFVYNLKTGETQMFILNDNDDMALYVGWEYAHGYLVTQPDTIVVYMVEGKYNPKSENSIPYHEISSIKNEVEKLYQNPILSEKDK